MRALVLAAGRALDLHPITQTRPKAMIRVGGRPMLESIINGLVKVGVTGIDLVIGLNGEKINEYFQDGSDFDVQITYHNQPEPTGIGDAISLACDRFTPGEHFILAYGDTLTTPGLFSTLVRAFHNYKAPVAAVSLTADTSIYGNIYMDSEGRITRIVEKPKQKGLGNYVLVGAFVLPQGFFGILKKSDNNVIQAFETLCSEPGFYAAIWDEDWIDTQYPWEILRANKLAMSTMAQAVIHETVKLNGMVTLRGPVYIEKDVEINSGSVVEGPCFIGEGSYIGNNVLVRKGTCIGPNSVIGYGVELKNCILFGNSKVGRLSFIGDSVIGEYTNIGSGVMTINENIDGQTVSVDVRGELIDSRLKKLGAFIGDYSRIGAANTIKPGALVDANSIIPHNLDVPLKRPKKKIK